MNTPNKLLLIDTCGETAGVALSLGRQVIFTMNLARGTASGAIVSVIRTMVAKADWRLSELNAVGVVIGPGSFTGMRAGLATAKGLCEAAGLPLVGVSRLAVLAEVSSIRDGFVALDAGRGELYMREERSGREALYSMDALEEIVSGRKLVVAEAHLVERLAMYAPILHPLHVGDALNVVLQGLRAGGNDVSLADANYVRDESDIYRKPVDAPKPLRTVA